MHIPIKNKNTFKLALNGDLLYIEIHNAINSQIEKSEKKLPKSNFSTIFIHHIELSMDKLSNHLENIPKLIPNKMIKNVLINLFLNFKLSSIFLISPKNSFIYITLI